MVVPGQKNPELVIHLVIIIFSYSGTMCLVLGMCEQGILCTESYFIENVRDKYVLKCLDQERCITKL
jgi:hypothetical protein